MGYGEGPGPSESDVGGFVGDHGGGVQSQALGNVSAATANESGVSPFEKWHRVPCSLDSIQPFGTVGENEFGCKGPQARTVAREVRHVGHGSQSPERDVQGEEPEDRQDRVPARRNMATPPDEEEKSLEIGQGGGNTGDSKGFDFGEVCMHVGQKRAQWSMVNEPVVTPLRRPEQQE